MPTHNPATDPIRRAYLAHVANRPQLDPHDARCAALITHQATEWLREAWRSLEGRPDLQQHLKAAGHQLTALADRLRQEMPQGRAH